jgi:AcrR family transcriptional regulator
MAAARLIYLTLLSNRFSLSEEEPVSVKERRQREKQELRQEILEAARELFVQEGYEHVSMRKIADKIDYSPTTIYLYFRDKEDLLHSICDETFAKLVAEFQRIKTKTPDPVECLRRMGRAYIEFGLGHPNHYRVAFMTPHQECPGETPFKYQGSMGEKCFLQLRSTVEECIARGKVRPLEVEATSQALWCTVHGVTSALISFTKFPWVEVGRLIDQALDLMLTGLGR